MSTQFKKIKDYTDVELTEAVNESVIYLKGKSIDFYTILRGIDAYMERRTRKEQAETNKLAAAGLTIPVSKNLPEHKVELK